MKRLENRVGIVTGGANGIGELICTKLAAEGAGIVVADLDANQGAAVVSKIEAAGGQALFMPLDVTDLENWQRVVQQTQEQCGKLDLLVNVAGIANQHMLVEEIDLAREWHKIIEIDLTGSFYGMYAAIPALKAAGGGSIVNIASVAGLVSMTGVNGYSAAKGGLIALTRDVAAYYGPDNIRCNAVCPATTLSKRVEEMLEQVEGLEETLRSAVVLPRLGLPEDIADAVVFLASDEASYITGVALPVDGGYVVR